MDASGLYTDMGGEVGHLRLADDGPVGFGKAGSAEGFVSGDAVGRQGAALTERLIAQGKAPRLDSGRAQA